MPTYSMSEIGGCVRAVAARRAGIAKHAPPRFLETTAREGERHEEFIAADLEEHGWVAEPAGECDMGCQHDGAPAKGHHVEMQFPLFRLTGHVDRYVTGIGVTWHDTRHIAEFKALSANRAKALGQSLAHGTFRQEFYQYAVQVSLYHYATGLPILYAVKNRDSGNISTFEIAPPVPLDEIVDRLLGIEFDAIRKQLPDCSISTTDFWYRFCPYSHLHQSSKTDTPPEAEHAEAPPAEQVYQAALLYRATKTQIQALQAGLTEAEDILRGAVRANGDKPITITVPVEVGGVSSTLKISYVKPGKTVSYPKARIEEAITRKFQQLEVPQPELEAGKVLDEAKAEAPRKGYVRVDMSEKHSEEQ